MTFMEKHPKVMEWVRKGGLFLIFSWIVTALKAVMLMFLPALFHGMVGDVEWLFPGIPVELFGVGFKLSIIGNALELGGDALPTRPPFSSASVSISPSNAM